MAASVWITSKIVAAAHALDRAAEGAHDAGGERVVEAEGVADGVDLLADLEVGAGADPEGDERPRGASIFSTARSWSRAKPTIVASYSASPSVTFAESASCTTWKFVTTWPRSSQTKPEPVPGRHLEDVAGPEVHLLDLRRDEGDRARGAP